MIETSSGSYTTFAKFRVTFALNKILRDLTQGKNCADYPWCSGKIDPMHFNKLVSLTQALFLKRETWSLKEIKGSVLIMFILLVNFMMVPEVFPCLQSVLNIKSTATYHLVQGHRYLSHSYSSFV